MFVVSIILCSIVVHGMGGPNSWNKHFEESIDDEATVETIHDFLAIFSDSEKSELAKKKTSSKDKTNISLSKVTEDEDVSDRSDAYHQEHHKNHHEHHKNHHQHYGSVRGNLVLGMFKQLQDESCQHLA